MERKRCKKCRKQRDITKFSLTKRTKEGFVRSDVCRVCNYDGLHADERHKILREAYRNYLTFEQFVTDTGKDVIEFAAPSTKGSEGTTPVRISFTDLQQALRRYQDGVRAEGTVLSKRKEQAFHLNVIRDMLQRDVAEIMGITTVSVGQYVDQSMLQLCDYYFGEDTTNGSDTKSNS